MASTLVHGPLRHPRVGGGSEVVVVLVSADVPFAAGLRLKLEADEHTVLVAHDPAAAVRLIRRERPDLVFVDDAAGAAAGSEILACLDADPGLSATPVVTVRRSGGAGVPQIVYRLHVHG
jgi:DNA-binding response OmpR family regulator